MRLRYTHTQTHILTHTITFVLILAANNRAAPVLNLLAPVLLEISYGFMLTNVATLWSPVKILPVFASNRGTAMLNSYSTYLLAQIHTVAAFQSSSYQVVGGDTQISSCITLGM